MSYVSNVDWEKCSECGDCLVKCPVIDYTHEEAINEIHLVLNNKTPVKLFDQCTYCFNCNNYCPENLKPHELFLQRAFENRGSNIPEVIPYLCNGRGNDDAIMFQDIYKMLTKDENKILDKWSKLPLPSEEVLWVGCIGRMSCYDLENSKIFKDIPKYGPRDLCCGELPYRLGSYEAYSTTIERTLKQLKKLKTKRLICYCGSCYNYLTNILENVYGDKLPFEVISMYQWLLEKVKAEEISLQKKLNFKAAVHESCYVSELPGFDAVLKEVYQSAGAEVADLEHHGECNLSCGAVSMVRTLNVTKSIFKEQRKKYKEVKRAGAKEIAVNCPGCFITLSFSKNLFNKKLRYMPDELLRAYGDEITIPLNKRIKLFIMAFTKRAPFLLKKTKDKSFFTPPSGVIKSGEKI